MARNERAPADGALGGLRVSTDDTHHTSDHPQGKSQRDRTSALLTALRVKYRVLAEYRPLAIGIRAEAYAASPGVTHKAINYAPAMHCRCDNYLQYGPRYALDGAQSGEVAQEHRVAAVLGLARRSEKSVKPPILSRRARFCGRPGGGHDHKRCLPPYRLFQNAPRGIGLDNRIRRGPADRRSPALAWTGRC
jgi:hypothetical protein